MDPEALLLERQRQKDREREARRAKKSAAVPEAAAAETAGNAAANNLSGPSSQGAATETVGNAAGIHLSGGASQAAVAETSANAAANNLSGEPSQAAAAETAAAVAAAAEGIAVGHPARVERYGVGSEVAMRSEAQTEAAAVSTALLTKPAPHLSGSLSDRLSDGLSDRLFTAIEGCGSAAPETGAMLAASLQHPNMMATPTAPVAATAAAVKEDAEFRAELQQPHVQQSVDKGGTGTGTLPPALDAIDRAAPAGSGIPAARELPGHQSDFYAPGGAVTVAAAPPLLPTANVGGEGFLQAETTGVGFMFTCQVIRLTSMRPWV